MKYFFALLLFIFLASCKGPDQRIPNLDALEQIRATNSIRVGWAPYAPYVSANPETLFPEGYYVDLVESMGSEAGLDIKWVETTWGNMIADIENEKFDMMGAPVFRTIPRAKSVAFTRPIGQFGLSAIARADDTRFSELEDLGMVNLTVSVTQGEVGHEYALRHLPEAELTVRQSGDISLALVDVIQNRADVGIADSWTIQQFVAKHPGQAKDLFSGRNFGLVGAGWFVRQEDQNLRVFLDTSIDWLESSGEIERISSKYSDLPEVQ